MNKGSAIVTVALFLGLAAAGSGLALVKYRSIRRAAAEGGGFEPAAAVELAAARTISWQRTADLVGTVIAQRSVTVSNELPGTVKEVHFESGAIVEPGDILLVLDDSTDRAELVAAEANVRVAEARVVESESRVWLAGAEVDRLATALERGAANRIELDRAATEQKKAEAERTRAAAEVDLARAQVVRAQSRVDKMTLRAPFRGRTGLRNTHEGQFLAEGATVVSLESVGDTIFLDFAIPQEHLARVKPGVAVMATGDAFGPEPMRVEVAAVDAAVNNSTRNVRVRAVVDNRNDRLRPGMFVQITVPVDAPRPVLVVPGSAVRRSSYADQVFVVEEEKAKAGPPAAGAAGHGTEGPTYRVRQRFVRLGPAIGEDVVVEEGLAEGETVAASGAFKLRDGALVAPAPAVPAGGPRTDVATVR